MSVVIIKPEDEPVLEQAVEVEEGASSKVANDIGGDANNPDNGESLSKKKRKKRRKLKETEKKDKYVTISMLKLLEEQLQSVQKEGKWQSERLKLMEKEVLSKVPLPHLEGLSQEVGSLRKELGTEKEERAERENKFQEEAKLQAERLQNVEEVIMAEVPLLGNVTEDIGNIRKELCNEREERKEMQKESLLHGDKLKILEGIVPRVESLSEEVGCFRTEVRKELEGMKRDHNQLQKESETQAVSLKNIEEVMLEKVPFLESLAEDMGGFKNELGMEREGREEDMKHFMECIQNLMHEIVQINLKLGLLEERIAEAENFKPHSQPSMSSSLVPDVSEQLLNHSTNEGVHNPASPQTRMSRGTAVIPEADSEDDDDLFERVTIPVNSPRAHTGKPTNLHAKGTLSSSIPKPFQFACLCGKIFNRLRLGDIEEHSLKTCKATKNFSLEVFRKPGYEKKLCKVNVRMGNLETTSGAAPIEQGRQHGRDSVCKLSCLCGIQCCDGVALDNHLSYFVRQEAMETSSATSSAADADPVEETSEKTVSFPGFQLSSIGHRLISQAHQHNSGTGLGLLAMDMETDNNAHIHVPETPSKSSTTKTVAVAVGPRCTENPVPALLSQVEAHRHENEIPTSPSVSSPLPESAPTLGLFNPDPQASTTTTNSIRSIMATAVSPPTPLNEWSPLPPAPIINMTSASTSFTPTPPNHTTTPLPGVAYPAPGPFFVQIDPSTGKLRMVELEQEVIQRLPPTGTISMPLLGSLPISMSLPSTGVDGAVQMPIQVPPPLANGELQQKHHAQDLPLTFVLPQSHERTVGGIPPPPPPPPPPIFRGCGSNTSPSVQPRRILPEVIGGGQPTGYLLRPTSSSTITVAPVVPLDAYVPATLTTSTGTKPTAAIMTSPNPTNKVKVIRKTLTKNSSPVILVYRRKGQPTTKAGTLTSSTIPTSVAAPPPQTATPTSKTSGVPSLPSQKQTCTNPRCPCDSAKSPCMNCICAALGYTTVPGATATQKVPIQRTKSLTTPTSQPESAPVVIPIASSVVIGDTLVPFTTSVDLISTTPTPVIHTPTTTPALVIPAAINGLVLTEGLRNNSYSSPLQNIQLPAPPRPVRTELPKFTYAAPTGARDIGPSTDGHAPVNSGETTSGSPAVVASNYGTPTNVITIPLRQPRKQSFPPRQILDGESQVPAILSDTPGPTPDQTATPRKVCVDGDVVSVTVTHHKAAAAGHYLPFLCVCGMEFPSETGLSEHIAQKTVEEFVGTGSSMLAMSKAICKRKPPSKKPGNMPTSDNRHGKDPSQPMSCLCGKEYGSPHSLHWHIKVHTLDKAFICKTCGKGFVYGCLLNYHLRDAHKTGPRFKSVQMPTSKGGMDTMNGSVNDVGGADAGTPLNSPTNESKNPGTAPIPTNSTGQEQPQPGIKTKVKKKKKKIASKLKSSSAFSATNPNPTKNKTNLRYKKRHGRDPWTRLHCLCGLKYLSNVTLYDHVRYFTGRNLLSCKSCGKQFVYASQLKVHSHQVHKANFRLDGSCWKHFSNAKRLENYRKRKQLLTGANRELLCEIKREIEEDDSYAEEDLGIPEIPLHPPPDPSEPRYCSCNQVSYGKMIACDNKKCRIEWFHYDCVGVVSEPEGKWYCPNCTDNLNSAD